MRIRIGLVLTGLLLLALAAVLAATSSSSACGSVLNPVAVGEIRMGLPQPRAVVLCQFEHNERWLLILLTAAPAACLTVAGVVALVTGKSLGVGGWAVLLGLAALSIAAVLAATPPLPPCGSVLDPVPQGQIDTFFVDLADCRFLHNARWLPVLLIGTPAVYVTVAGVMVLSTGTALGPGGWAMLFGLAGLSAAAVLAFVPVQPDCGTVLDPTTRAEFRYTQRPIFSFTCRPEAAHRRTWTLVVLAAATACTISGWLLAWARRAAPDSAWSRGGVPLVAGLSLLSVCVVLLATPTTIPCGSLLDPSPLAERGFSCDPEHDAQWIYVIAAAVPTVWLTYIGISLARR